MKEDVVPEKVKQAMRSMPDPPNALLPKPIVKTTIADFNHLAEEDSQPQSVDPDADTLVDSGICDYHVSPITNSARNTPYDSDTDIQCPCGYRALKE
jgi:hypothetical protein